MKSGDLKIVFHAPWRKGQPHRVELRHDCRLVGEGGGITQAEALGVLRQYLTSSGAPDAWVQMVERAVPPWVPLT